MESPEGQELAVLCLDYGYRLAPSAGELTRTQIDFLVAALNRRWELLTTSRTLEPGGRKFVFSEE